MGRAFFALVLVVAMVHVATAQLQGDECPENMVFKSCGTACPNTCDTPIGTPQRCTKQCVIGCQCKEGFVLSKHGPDGKCVHIREC